MTVAVREGWHTCTHNTDHHFSQPVLCSARHITIVPQYMSDSRNGIDANEFVGDIGASSTTIQTEPVIYAQYGADTCPLKRSMTVLTLSVIC